MKYLLFLIWLLGIGAQGQQIPGCQSAKLYYNGVLVDEEPHCTILTQPVNMPTALDDITRMHWPREYWGDFDLQPMVIMKNDLTRWGDGPAQFVQGMDNSGTILPWTSAQKAADETDGKPPSKLNCTMDAFTHKISPPECADERVDVPAVQHKNKEIVANCYIVNNLDEDTSGKPPCTREVETYTCKDKSRVLLRSEDGRAHCIKFPE